jgi:putative ABC transport system substrate-binding protein
MIRRRAFLAGFGSAAVAATTGANAQARRPTVIAFSDGNDAERLALLRAGMQDFGYVEGRDFVLAFFNPGSPAIEEELRRVLGLMPNLIVSGNSAASLALAKLAPHLPLVSANMTETAALELVGPNFGRPIGNVTGVVAGAAGTAGEFPAKLFELAHELRSSAAIGAWIPAQNEQILRAVATATGERRGFRPVVEVARATGASPLAAKLSELERVFAVFVSEGVGVTINSIAFLGGVEISARSRVTRIPVLHSRPEYVEEGGLIAFGADTRRGYRRAAHFVDKLLRGARVADLPMERNEQPILAVNLRVAREQEFEIPAQLVARADVVIE